MAGRGEVDLLLLLLVSSELEPLLLWETLCDKGLDIIHRSTLNPIYKGACNSIHYTY